MAEPPVTFAGVLRQLRTGAGLTQEVGERDRRLSHSLTSPPP